VLVYHEGMLQLRAGRFERALEPHVEPVRLLRQNPHIVEHRLLEAFELHVDGVGARRQRVEDVGAILLVTTVSVRLVSVSTRVTDAPGTTATCASVTVP
jgi:hypothetical protein